MLRLHLPLNGNLNNYGLFDTTVSHYGAVVNTSGKIGSCYQFGTETSYLTIPKEVMTDLTTECTVSFWIKLLTRNTQYETYFQAGLGGLPWSHYVFGLLRNNNNNDCCFCISDGGTASSTSYRTPNLETNVWYHITLVYKTGHCLIYMNGKLYQDYTTSISPTFNTITTITIGCNNNKTGYQSHCLMNDFRIYDNALSPIEIKLLSQALVLQYILSGYTKNIVNTTKAITVPSNNSMAPIDDGVKTLGNNIDTYCILPLTQNLQTGTTYTLSFHATPVPDGSKLIFGVGSQNSSGQKYCGNLDVHGGYNTFTFSPPVDISLSDGLYLDDNNRTGYPIVEMKWFKIEEGSKATPWVPSENDARYSSMGLDDGIEYDVSGYGHNGTKFGNGITYISDTPRYNTATLFGSNTSYIKCGEITTAGFSDSYSFSWWAKASTFGGNKMIWAFLDGNHLNLYNCNTWNTLDGNNNPIQAPGTTTQVTRPTGNVWHHFVITGDGTATKMYLDGSLYGQAKTYKPITGKQIQINGNSTGTSYKFSDLNISDFRVYATCLDAENVIALYNAPISVSSNGTLLTSGEFTEV